MSQRRRRTTSFNDDKEKKPEVDVPVTGVTVTERPEGQKITTVIACSPGTEKRSVEISYTDTKVIGNGSFGVVFQVELLHNRQIAAVKKVLQDRRFKNRELDIVLKLDHPNIVSLLYYFYSRGKKKDEVYLNLMMEFIPETLYQVIRRYTCALQMIPSVAIKLYTYQALRGAAYIHELGICHRDFKPQNMLVDSRSGVLKICDFGSAKTLTPGQPNVSYICSRYYRAPELIFGATEYTDKIDIWSLGCVLGEMMLGFPLFAGDTGVDQLVEIVRKLGSPSKSQVQEMCPNTKLPPFPRFDPRPWVEVFKAQPLSAIDLISKMLVYVPNKRPTALDCMTHPYFKDLRKPETLYDGRPLPNLFNFSAEEMKSNPNQIMSLIPPHMQVSL